MTSVNPRVSRRTGLARALSKRGVCSRSQAAEWIRSGRVSVNGLLRRDPETPVNLDNDVISLDGLEVKNAAPVYFLLNKPRGIVTTASDDKGRQTVLDLLPAGVTRVAPVGRLDKASEGLLLLTNDSEWGARILDPVSHLDKTYHVQIRMQANEMLIRRLQAGVRTGHLLLRVKKASVIRQGKVNSWLEICLDEGKNRQIRRIFQVLEIEVLRIVRIAVGPLVLGTLPKGAIRELTSNELASIDAALGRQSSLRRQTHRKYVQK